MSSNPSYVPALGIAGLTQTYDAVMATLFQEHRYRLPVVQAIGAKPGEVVIDVGCGTATLSLLIQRETPQAVVTACDIDPVILQSASRKAHARGSTLRLTRASAACLPYASSSADHAVSSLMFHHLSAPQKRDMLAEILRVLRPGGRFYLFDFGPPASAALRALLVPALSRLEHAYDNLHGRLPALLEAAGFANVQAHDVAFDGLLKLNEGTRPA